MSFALTYNFTTKLFLDCLCYEMIKLNMFKTSKSLQYLLAIKSTSNIKMNK